ncbi:MAG: AI-2E family transporter YdiK [Betaproteobacteria bacterium]|nr:AI-2E family transporter YdiK [Betaproteobacteria bacterium]
MNKPRQDLARTALAVLFLAALVGLSLWILIPFLGAVAWATMVAVATWPALRAVQARLWNRRALAVAVMTFALLVVLIVPVSWAITTIVGHGENIVSWAKAIADFRVSSQPTWLARLPLVGELAAQAWQQIAVAGVGELATKAGPYAAVMTRWFIAQVGNLGLLFAQLLLTVILAAVLYARGEGAAEGVQRFARRLAGERGAHAVLLAAQAIRGVALGVVVTAFAQALLGGIGLVIVGVPFAAFLTAVMFVLAVAQIGAVPVLLIPVIWLYWTGSSGWGTFLLVWAIVVGGLDNVLRPILIRSGANLPLLLVFAGVVGGLIAFGLIGIFIGPIVLAVGYTLLKAWMDEAPPDA